MANEDVVANALKMDDTPDMGKPELDPESAQLLQLFDEMASEDLGEPVVKPLEEEKQEPTAEVAEVKAPSPEAEKEDGQGEPEPQVAPEDSAPAEPEPDSDASKAEEPSAEVAETPPLEIPEAVKPPAEQPSEEDRNKWRADALAQVESHYERLMAGEETRDQLLTEPEKALPKILASAYMDMYDSLLGGVGQTLPNQVQQVMTAVQQSQQYETQFFDKWPKLKDAYADAEKQGVIQRAIHSYRQMNPEAPVNQAIEEAGAMAMVALRIPAEEGKKAETPSPPQDKGFAPASPGGGAEIGTAPPAPKQLNEFERLAQELLDDEEV